MPYNHWFYYAFGDCECLKVTSQYRFSQIVDAKIEPIAFNSVLSGLLVLYLNRAY